MHVPLGANLKYLTFFYSFSDSCQESLCACIMAVWYHLSYVFVKEPLCGLHSGELEAVVVCASNT